MPWQMCGPVLHYTPIFALLPAAGQKSRATKIGKRVMDDKGNLVAASVIQGECRETGLKLAHCAATIVWQAASIGSACKFAMEQLYWT